ncbi:hypothetical protein [Streptomyces sp. CRN 30]|uniref:hypothetical protein n=1 Tax=Streptomyces sp. CRN 30 TaxID=3075613 RepID=UPI002A80390F|nr:hypothetical protein [Streptomyces sp. CRN 30]
MGEQGKRAAGSGGHAGRAAATSGDLADVDLRTLRAMNDPELIDAVDRALGDPRALTDVWYVAGEVAGDEPGDGSFSAGRTAPGHGEDAPG